MAGGAPVKKKRQLSRLLMLREIQYQKEMERLTKEQGQLNREAQRLEMLEEYQKSYVWSQGRQVSGIALNSAQMMAHSVDQAVRHQRQQVAVQEVQCRSAREKLMREKVQLRTAEALFDRHLQVLNKKEEKREQKFADEIASRLSMAAELGW